MPLLHVHGFLIHVGAHDDGGVIGDELTPYNNSQITDAQFKLDEPSGVKIDPTDVTVDGASGIEFLSSAPRLNDTREVWFIHGGFLYEVPTYKELDA